MAAPDRRWAGGDGLVARLRVAGCVFAEDEAAQLRATFPAGPHREAAVRRREQGTPLEHVLGFAVFAGTRVLVDPGVFVPRRRAEPLVQLCVTAARALLAENGGGSGACVVDLGCGSGAIAAAVSDRLAASTVLAVDDDPVAVACAGRNAAEHSFVVHRGNWFDALPLAYRGQVVVAVAYLPHVPTPDLAQLSADYRTAEPLAAVHGGDDGLDPLRTVLDQAPPWLRPGGAVVTMSATQQEPWVSAVAVERGWRVRATADEDVFYVLSPPIR